MADRIEADVTCPVCLELFSDPVLLRCLHTLCRDCSKLPAVQIDPNTIQCPTCRKTTAVSDVTNDFKTQNWVDLYKQLKMQDGGPDARAPPEAPPPYTPEVNNQVPSTQVPHAGPGTGLDTQSTQPQYSVTSTVPSTPGTHVSQAVHNTGVSAQLSNQPQSRVPSTGQGTHGSVPTNSGYRSKAEEAAAYAPKVYSPPGTQHMGGAPMAHMNAPHEQINAPTGGFNAPPGGFNAPPGGFNAPSGFNAQSGPYPVPHQGGHVPPEYINAPHGGFNAPHGAMHAPQGHNNAQTGHMNAPQGAIKTPYGNQPSAPMPSAHNPAYPQTNPPTNPQANQPHHPMNPQANQPAAPMYPGLPPPSYTDSIQPEQVDGSSLKNFINVDLNAEEVFKFRSKAVTIRMIQQKAWVVMAEGGIKVFSRTGYQFGRYVTSDLEIHQHASALWSVVPFQGGSDKYIYRACAVTEAHNGDVIAACNGTNSWSVLPSFSRFKLDKVFDNVGLVHINNIGTVLVTISNKHYTDVRSQGQRIYALPVSKNNKKIEIFHHDNAKWLLNTTVVVRPGVTRINIGANWLFTTNMRATNGKTFVVKYDVSQPTTGAVTDKYAQFPQTTVDFSANANPQICSADPHGNAVIAAAKNECLVLLDRMNTQIPIRIKGRFKPNDVVMESAKTMLMLVESENAIARLIYLRRV